MFTSLFEVLSAVQEHTRNLVTATQLSLMLLLVLTVTLHALVVIGVVYLHCTVL